MTILGRNALTQVTTETKILSELPFVVCFLNLAVIMANSSNWMIDERLLLTGRSPHDNKMIIEHTRK